MNLLTFLLGALLRSDVDPKNQTLGNILLGGSILAVARRNQGTLP